MKLKGWPVVRISEFFDPSPEVREKSCPVCGRCFSLEIPAEASVLKGDPFANQVACEVCAELSRKIAGLEDVLSRAAWTLKKKTAERERLDARFDSARRDIDLESKFAAVGAEVAALKKTISTGVDALAKYREKIQIRKESGP